MSFTTYGVKAHRLAGPAWAVWLAKKLGVKVGVEYGQVDGHATASSAYVTNASTTGGYNTSGGAA